LGAIGQEKRGREKKKKKKKRRQITNDSILLGCPCSHFHQRKTKRKKECGK
jgi:hypothetical protein